VTGRTLTALAGDTLDDPGVLKEAKYLMRHLLEVHLGARPLGSRALIEIYGQGGKAPVAAPALDAEQAS